MSVGQQTREVTVRRNGQENNGLVASVQIQVAALTMARTRNHTDT